MLLGGYLRQSPKKPSERKHFRRTRGTVAVVTMCPFSFALGQIFRRTRFFLFVYRGQWGLLAAPATVGVDGGSWCYHGRGRLVLLL
jgi:hypothetical protein